MFTRWGDLVYRLRFAVLGVVTAAMLALGGFGFGLENHLSSSGWFDPTSESTKAAELKDQVYGRDHSADILLLFTAPEGKTIDDPEFSRTVVDKLNSLPKEYPLITKVNGAYWQTETGEWIPSVAGSKDKKHAFAALSLEGNNDTEMLRNYAQVQDAFQIPGVQVEVAGLQPIGFTLNDTIASDVKRMELLALPAVAVLLFFIFGGIVAASLPLIIGGLTILASNGIIMGLTKFTEVNSFVSAVVSMIGLGLAIDYGLFIVSRFREELAEGYDTKAAVRRSVMTAGRTVTSSATMIIAASAGMLLFPQGFLKSVAYGTIAAVLLAMVSALTVLPAMLSILGPRVDMLGLKWIRKTKTADEVENSFWGRMTAWVMKHPLKVAIPLTIVLLLLIIPVKNLQFGGISETYLPPDNPTRLAQEHFDEIFPLRKSDPVQLIIVTDNSRNIGQILAEANQAPGLVKNSQFGIPAKPPNGSNVWVSEATVTDSAHPEDTVDYLRSMPVPEGAEVMVTGQPVMMMDSINSLLDLMPLMIALVLLVTTILMFLTFGSLVLPLKAALMSALGLGSTLGILTWIFIDGHGAGLLNFTPQPIMSPVLVLIIAIIYGLSVDYEVFLLSRMVEARTQGASTTESVRVGTAQTGRIITAAALILLVVTGAFAFSELVMMQYIAYGMVAALFIDATVLRMLLVPATMKLLGDDCWWAPAWMKKIQEKVGLGEPILDDERPGGGDMVDLVKTTPVTDPVTLQMPALADGTPATKPRSFRKIRPRMVDSEAPTERLDDSTTVLPVVTASGGIAQTNAAEAVARATGAIPKIDARPGSEAAGSRSTRPTDSDSTAVGDSGQPAPSPGVGVQPRAASNLTNLSDLGSGAGERQRSGETFQRPSGEAAQPGEADRNRDDATRSSGGSTPYAGDHTARGADADIAADSDGVRPHSHGTVPQISQPSTRQPTAPAAESDAPASPATPLVAGAERVLPPPGVEKLPPHPATRAQLYQPHPPAAPQQPEQPRTPYPSAQPPQPQPPAHQGDQPGHESNRTAETGRPPQAQGDRASGRAAGFDPSGRAAGSDRQPLDQAHRVPGPQTAQPHPTPDQPSTQTYPAPGQPPAQPHPAPGQPPTQPHPAPGHPPAQPLPTPGQPPAPTHQQQAPAQSAGPGRAGSGERSNQSRPGHGQPSEPEHRAGDQPPAQRHPAPGAPAPGHSGAPQRRVGSPADAPTEAIPDATAPDQQPTQQAAEERPQGSGPRGSIEQWMSDLRSARRRPAAKDDDDEGRHRGGEGRTVSVNELLRRQNRD
ncbi:MMPL family transporter [Nocardia otitidiscaviarum]|uniref:MMPL family transporter n=1 Tax=Nocardia otitidiscaviarum TaxID=1823 RepID=UPI0004A7303B|nr:MMPL family transporter [Nocardia otitidiscaviarum]MBF6137096.1 MMPL family transporter [Nocardia otitidiscaviarum]MBF6487995.1 MMPL family transporter [Nocardia otitidiscaviarum]